MPNELRVRSGFLGGLIENNPLSAAATTLTSAGLASMPVIASTHHMALVLDPDGFAGAPEVVYVTAHSAGATSATILRGQEGSVARQHDRDAVWVHSATALDIMGSGAKALRSAAYTVTTSDVAIPWDSEEYDTDSYHDNSTNPSRLTVPTPGIYLVGVNVAHSGQNIARMLLTIKKNGVIIPGSGVEVSTSAGGIYPAPAVSTTSLCTAAGDYFEAFAFVTGTQPAFDTAKSAFWIVRLTR